MMKSAVAAFCILAGLFVLFGLRFGWYVLGDLSEDTATTTAVILVCTGSVLTFIPER